MIYKQIKKFNTIKEVNEFCHENIDVIDIYPITETVGSQTYYLVKYQVRKKDW